ncbi:hypothetical protein TRFO_21859 [Tritrichomonas foetus]|uniref:BTB domain-containing protein n=1 Tax=Tritrichomonas foetus TaxID=1144522 RepID=A0A1J4KHI1_9EUKA|nr:hypothetical protein TRFO_21859 [Tritrichomonas foetus]|eukprot:OHT09292.1 hypothetical protein TRFO_21859 [Tritrichomonas foetus]
MNEHSFDFPATFHIYFRKEEFPVNKDLFCFFSPKFQSLIQSAKDSSIDLTDNRVLDISFAMFVRACQQLPYSINPSNYYDIRYLANDYKVKHLIDECNEFQEKCIKSDLVIHRLYYKIRKGSHLKKIIKIVAYNLPDLLNKNELLFVPNEYLKSILQERTNSMNQSQIFNFLVKKFDNDHSSASLFSLLDPSKLTIYEIKWLLDHHPLVNTSFIPAEIRARAKTINDEINEQQEKINEYEEKIKNDLSKSAFNQVFHRLKHIKNKFVKHGQIHKIVSELGKEEFEEIGEIEKEQSVSDLNSQATEYEDRIADLDLKTQDLEFKFMQLLQFLESK